MRTARVLSNLVSSPAVVRLAPLMDRPAVSAFVHGGIRAERTARGLLAGPAEIARGGRRSDRAAGWAHEATLADEHGARGADGVPVRWHEGGAGEPLLLLNGWTASGIMWPAQWIAELERHYRVIRVHNRGTGWSRFAPSPFTIGDLADDARLVLRACGVESATVLGLSMGGMIAQELAIRHPEVVDRLFLVATGPPIPARVAVPVATAAGLLRPLPPGRDVREHVAEIFGQFTGRGFAAASPEVLEQIADDVLRRATPRATILAQARAIAAWSRPERLSRLRMPTTVVHGDDDVLMPTPNGPVLAALIPDARYVELPGIGHMVPYEAEAELTKILGV